jgi:hypothetical protein
LEAVTVYRAIEDHAVALIVVARSVVPPDIGVFDRRTKENSTARLTASLLGYMSEQAIYMVNSFQFTRSARLIPAYRP